MKYSSTLYARLDVHKESIAVAYVSDAGDAEMFYLGAIGTRQLDIDKFIRQLHFSKHRARARAYVLANRPVATNAGTSRASTVRPVPAAPKR